ncbi:MAG: hypothetical protein ACK57R_11080 [Dolichospermum sp.]
MTREQGTGNREQGTGNSLRRERCCGAGILPAIIIQIKCSTAY